VNICKRTYINWNILLVLTVFTWITACSKDPIREEPVDPPDDTVTEIKIDKGVFVVNEGNYNWGNATVTFFDHLTSSVIPDIFQKVNQRSLGDVAESMTISGNYGFLVINNSNRIEVVSMTDFTSVKSVTGLNSPRFMTVVSPSKAYISNLQGGISIFNLNSQTISGTVPTSTWTENMIRYKNVVLVTSIGSFNEPSSGRNAFVFVLDNLTDKIVDSIATGKEPIGLVIDKKEKVWVLCSGGYDNFEAPTLLRVDPEQRIVEKKFTFDNPLQVPSRLCMNPTGDTMYFLRGGVFRMAVTDLGLPQQAFIPSDGRLLYGLSIQPSTGHIFTSDAVDYVQNGKVYEYRQSGTLVRSFTAGRIPGSFCFKD
jgi:hypothetical protein